MTFTSLKGKEKLEKIIFDGIKNIQLITDWDGTISEPLVNGKHNSSLDALKQVMCKEYKTETQKLFDCYYSNEQDVRLDTEEKSQLMSEWWIKVQSLLSKYKISKEKFLEAEKYIHIRDGAVSLFQNMYNSNTPITIFSEGNGNVIKSYLSHNNILKNNLWIYSNFIKFDSTGNSLVEPSNLIHSSNKNAQTVLERGYQFHDKKNIIILGDSLNDSMMADGIDANIVLKVGIINFDYDKKLKDYKENFDVVLTSNPISYLNSLMDKLIRTKYLKH